MVVERRSLHDPALESRPKEEDAADRIAMVTKLVRTHHGWDDDETRPRSSESVIKLLLASDVSFMAMGGYATGRREQCTEASTMDA